MKTLNISILFIAILVSSCQDDWLEERSNKSVVTPSTLADLQGLLDNTQNLNGNSFVGGGMPSIGESATDTYYLLDNTWNALPVVYRNTYIWNRDVFEGSSSQDWNRPYIGVLYTNMVLEGLAKIQPGEEKEVLWNALKGSALFHRANIFFHLAQTFAVPYRAESAASELGIPLRLSSDFNVPTQRASLAATYNQIIGDLHSAYDLLPTTQESLTRPTKQAAAGLLSRIYLSMGRYSEAISAADSCLRYHSTLLDFNDLEVDANLPFERYNGEDIFHMCLQYSHALVNHFIDTALFNSYADSDLRKVAYFRDYEEGIKFKGSYIRSASVFYAGIATDEIYLNRAECYARLGKTDEAMQDLNTLLVTRWKSGDFVPFYITDAQEALQMILDERKKELIFRGIRWMDLRRFGTEAPILVRNVAGQRYELPAGDSRYTFPIPDDIVAITGIEQNKR